MNQKQSKLDQVISKARQDADVRSKGYREQALKLYPWVCAKCTREYTHKNLWELEVHHKNSDHDDNPPDGSNWELLCMYCHEHEHTKFSQPNVKTNQRLDDPVATHNPFADLKSLLKK